VSDERGAAIRMNMIQAINSAMDVMMGRDPNVVVMGEDVGYFGGVFRATAGLQAKHGKTRVFDTPISEGGIIGVAVGMGAYGLRPVPEIQFADYIYPGLDQLVSEAARLRYRSGGEYISPITVRSPFGGGIFGGQTHSQSPEAIFAHISGIKTVIPSTPYDAKGLLIAAIEDNDPTIFFEPKRIYNGPFHGHYDRPAKTWGAHPGGEVPEGYYRIDIGKAAVVREGADVTILCYGAMVHVVANTIEELGSEQGGLDAEIIDLRSIVPLDIETIEASVKKTGRCVIVHEATRTAGFGAELAALVQERCFYHLEAPIERVTGFDTPYPHSLEWAYFPGPVRIGEALKKVMRN
jgi:2-oxoisovalerate dehydrogenase E1 component subunit beta